MAWLLAQQTTEQFPWIVVYLLAAGAPFGFLAWRGLIREGSNKLATIYLIVMCFVYVFVLGGTIITHYWPCGQPDAGPRQRQTPLE